MAAQAFAVLTSPRIREVTVVIAVLSFQKLVRVYSQLEPDVGRSELLLRRPDSIRFGPSRQTTRRFRDENRRIDAVCTQTLGDEFQCSVSFRRAGTIQVQVRVSQKGAK